MADRGVRRRPSRPRHGRRGDSGAVRSMRPVGRGAVGGSVAAGLWRRTAEGRALMAQASPIRTQERDDGRRRGPYGLRARLRRLLFPVSYTGAASRANSLEEVCRSLCPNAEVALYSFPLGGTVDEAVSSTGEPYASLPNAHKFEQSYDSSCSCRAPGQSWAEALAAAEAKYGRHSHDIYVTVKDAERMSRPVRDRRRNRPPPIPDNRRSSRRPASISTASTRRSAPRPRRSAVRPQAFATRKNSAR